jgi:mono/diheme cytochrome c family protein
MRFGRSRFLVPAMAVVTSVACVEALAQGPTYGLGRTPTAEEVKAWDIAVSREGKDLPPGRGTAVEGGKLYQQKCVACHGPTGTEGKFLHGVLVGGKGSLTTLEPIKTVGSYWPYATTLFDFINRAMPMDKPGSLSADEVYALTAFLLYRNDIIQESDVVDAASLPKIQMPNRNGFFPAEPEWKRGFYQPYFATQPQLRKKKP